MKQVMVAEAKTQLSGFSEPLDAVRSMVIFNLSTFVADLVPRCNVLDLFSQLAALRDSLAEQLRSDVEITSASRDEPGS